VKLWAAENAGIRELKKAGTTSQPTAFETEAQPLTRLYILLKPPVVYAAEQFDVKKPVLHPHVDGNCQTPPSTKRP